MFFLLPLLPTIANGIAVGIVGASAIGATAKGIQWRLEADEIREKADSRMREKSYELERETEITKSALEVFGKEKLAAISQELNDAEKALSRFYVRQVAEIKGEYFPNGSLSVGNAAASFGAFGSKCVSLKSSDEFPLPDPFAFLESGCRKLEAAQEFKCRADVSCELMEGRIQAMKALRKRIAEGSEVLSFLREKLRGLLDTAKTSGKSNPMVFSRMLYIALMLKRVVEVDVCSLDGSLSEEAERLFKEARLEAV